MTSDHDALLRAICENPREDTPRLAFADWLEENGQAERAAFIRRDIAVSLLDEWDADRLRWEAAQARRGEWFDWFGRSPLPGLHSHELSWQTWLGARTPSRRGFPFAVSVNDLGVFRQRAAELFAGHPVEYLAFRHGLPDLNRFVAEPWFTRATGLEWVQGRYTARSLRPLLDGPGGLDTLAMTNRAVNSDGLTALFESRRFPCLSELCLLSTPVQVVRAALDSFGRPPWSACSLRSLTIRGDGLNHDVLFLACALPPSLRILDLALSHINSAQCREFAGAKALSGLRMLTLNSNGIGNDGAAALFTSPHLAGLKVLNLSYCQVGDEALRALLDDSPLADGLNLLDVTGSPASAEMKLAVKERMGDRVWV